MNVKALAVTALAAAAVAGGAGAASADAGTPPTPNAACATDSHWPGYAQGRPDGFDAHDNGAYLWHNPTGGWAVRVSHPRLPGGANQVAFSGRIISKGVIGHVQRVRDERNDSVSVSPNGHVLTFHLVNYGWVDGFDFTTSCTPALGVGLRADGVSIQPRFVHIGDRKVNPRSDPFSIRRRDDDPTTTTTTPLGP